MNQRPLIGINIKSGDQASVICAIAAAGNITRSTVITIIQKWQTSGRRPAPTRLAGRSAETLRGCDACDREYKCTSQASAKLPHTNTPYHELPQTQLMPFKPQHER